MIDCLRFFYRQGPETSIRFRQERSVQNENIEMKINEIKSKLQSCSSSLTSTDNRLSLIHLLTTKYRHSFLFGLFTFFTGSFLLYKYLSNNNRNHWISPIVFFSSIKNNKNNNILICFCVCVQYISNILIDSHLLFFYFRSYSTFMQWL